MRDAAFGCDWVGTAIPFQRCLMFIIATANKGSQLTAGKFVPVTNVTMMNVCILYICIYVCVFVCVCVCVHIYFNCSCLTLLMVFDINFCMEEMKQASAFHAKLKL